MKHNLAKQKNSVPLCMTWCNVADGLAQMAALLPGES